MGLVVENIAKEFKRADGESFFALKDISFELKPGEALGVIGRNGSGKSTLLKILSGIIKPSAGRATLKGRVVSILDIGTGFHPDLTGRENVFMSGKLLGANNQEIKQKFDEIVAFSEIEDFIDEPTKTYSSGMYLRLAFSVFANLDADIILLDEVMSVGDAAFLKKCRARINELLKSQKTLMLVSHNLNDFYEFNCQMLQLNKGTIQAYGDKNKIIRDYIFKINEGVVEGEAGSERQIKYYKANVSMNLLSVDIKPTIGQEITYDQEILMQLKVDKHFTGPLHAVIKILDSQEKAVLTITPFLAENFEVPQEIGIFIYNCFIPAKLLYTGTYWVELMFLQNGNERLCEYYRIKQLTVADGTKLNYSNFDMPFTNLGAMPSCKWKVERQKT